MRANFLVTEIGCWPMIWMFFSLAQGLQIRSFDGSCRTITVVVGWVMANSMLSIADLLTKNMILLYKVSQSSVGRNYHALNDSFKSIKLFCPSIGKIEKYCYLDILLSKPYNHNFNDLAPADMKPKFCWPRLPLSAAGLYR